MTSLLDTIYPGDDVTILVANVLIPVSVVTLMTMLAARTLLRRTPVAAHAAWLTCLVLATACPLVVFAASQVGISMLTLTPTPAAVETTSEPAASKGIQADASPAMETLPSDPMPATERFEAFVDSRWDNRKVIEAELRDHVSSAPVTTPNAPEADSFSWRTAVSVAVAVWAIGALGLALRLLHGAWCAIKLRRTTKPLDDSVFTDVLARVRQATSYSPIRSGWYSTRHRRRTSNHPAAHVVTGYDKRSSPARRSRSRVRSRDSPRSPRRIAPETDRNRLLAPSTHS